MKYAQFGPPAFGDDFNDPVLLKQYGDHIEADFSQADDLAAKNPEKLKELQALFLEEAKKYDVFPLDSRMWEAQVEALSDRYRVIAPDLRGFGESVSDDPFTVAEKSNPSNPYVTGSDAT